MEAYLEKVMVVEHRCPDCQGARVRPQRLLVTVGGQNLYQIGEQNFFELKCFLDALEIGARNREAGDQVLREIVGRLELLLGIGLDYLNFNRKSGTLSGGEAQRIRLSTPIGSGLMGMLYVLDEPSIGLHPKDNQKMIGTLRRLRDLGNTVLVVEHDEDTMRAADHVIEMGPGAGIHGGEVVVQGTLETPMAHQGRPRHQERRGASGLSDRSVLQRQTLPANPEAAPSHQHEHLKHIDEAKKPETRMSHRKHAHPSFGIERAAHHPVNFSDLKL